MRQWISPTSRLASALAGMVLLAGCAADRPPPARLGLRLAPAALGEAISVQQHLTVEKGERIDELDAALEIDQERLQMVGLAFGQRVLSLDFDGKELKSWRHFMLPAQVKAEDVLEDVQLTLWPVAAIAAALPKGWRIEEAGLVRRLSLNGEPVATITYSGQPRWGGTVVLDNQRYRYRLTITAAQ